MAQFVNIPFGTKGKECGCYILNLDQIKHMRYTERNEAIPNSEAYLEVYYGEGRQTYSLDEEQAGILFMNMGISKIEAEAIK